MVNSTSGKLVSVTIPGRIDIMHDAFSECNYITDLYLPDMEINEIRYAVQPCSSWGLGDTYNPETGGSQYREVTIHCSDGEAKQDEEGEWEYPDDAENEN